MTDWVRGRRTWPPRAIGLSTQRGPPLAIPPGMRYIFARRVGAGAGYLGRGSAVVRAVRRIFAAMILACLAFGSGVEMAFAATAYSANQGAGGPWMNAEGISNNNYTTWSAIRPWSGTGTGYLAGKSYLRRQRDNVLVEASGEKYSNGQVGGFTAGTTPYANNQIAEYVYGDGVTAWYNYSTGRYEWYYTKRSPVLFF